MSRRTLRLPCASPLLLLLCTQRLAQATLLRGIFDALVQSSGVELPITKTHEGWLTIDVPINGAKTRLALDTGSSILWTRPSAIKSESSLANPHRLSVADILDVTRHFSAQYGRGSVSGNVQDNQVELRSGKSQKCALGRATQQSAFWARQQTIDGILGLACGDDQAAGALRCAVPGPSASSAEQRVFSLQLQEDGGTLGLGFVPPQFQSSLIWMPPAKDCRHWNVPLLSLAVASRSAVPAEVVGGPRTVDALLDSGSDGIVGPTFAVISLARALGASPAAAAEGYGAEVTFYTVPCAAAVTLPHVTIGLGVRGSEHGEANVTLTGGDLVTVGLGNTSTCHLRLAGWGTESWILGRAFLTQLKAAVFDVDKKSVGIAL